MEKVWLKNYQAGVPAEIDPNKYASLNALFEEVFDTFKDKDAFTNMGKTITYADLEKKSKAFAAFLQSELKLKKGDSVALMMPNVLQYPIALLGTLRAGLIVSNVNPLYTPREVERQLKDAGCIAIVVLENFAHTLDQVLKNTKIEHVIVTKIGDLLSFPKSYIVNWAIKYIKRMVPKWSIKNALFFVHVLARGEKIAFQKPDIQGEDIAFLQYTGGTTDFAKGAMLTHRNILANLEQTFAWVKPTIELGKEIIITALPLYHIFSLLANGLLFLRIGALNVLVTNPRDTKSFIKILSRHRFTALTGVNPLFNALLQHPKFSSLDFSVLKITLGGGMAVQHSVAERWKSVTGIPILGAYGLTETCPAVCINPFSLKEDNGSVGLPIPSTDISIRDENDNELSFNQPGELCVFGPQVMKGYWNKPEQTKAALRAGWLKTGDIATIDEEGYVRIVDRKKDMILVSGFNVYPNEIEDVIALMPEVAEVAVIGVPYEGGEKVKAFVVKKDPKLTAEAIIQYCHTQLTGYKIPKEIEFRDTLPKSTVGKILRRALKEQSAPLIGL